MSVSALEIPFENPLRMLPQDGELPRDPRDNLIQFDADWFSRYIREWQDKVCYAQKWQLNDRIPFLLHASANFDNSGVSYTNGSLQLIDAHGKSWHTWTLQAAAAGHKIPVGGTFSDALTFYYRNIRLSTIASLPEGIYVFYLTVGFDTDNDTTVDYYRHCVSEPVSVAALHRGTGRVDYYNTTNTAHVPYRQTAIRWSLRGEFDIVDYAHISVDTQAQDGSYNTRLIASQGYRAAKFVTTARLPEWMLDKLGWAWDCNRVFFESSGFTKDEGAKWDYGRLPKHPSVTGSLPVVEFDNRQGSRQIYVGPFTVFTGSNFPYAVLSFVELRTASGDALSIGAYPVFVHNLTEENALVASYNSIMSAEGYNGSFAVNPTTHAIEWTNGSGDTFVSAVVRVDRNPLTVELHSTSSAQPLSFVNPDAGIDWGDGSGDYIAGSGSYLTPVHAYATPGTYTVLIFGKYEAVGIDDANASLIGGSVPVVLQTFYVANSVLLAAFDCRILLNANGAIGIFSLYNNSSLASVTHLSFLTLPNIQLASFAVNALNTTEASAIVLAFDTMVNTSPAPMNGRSLFVNGQAPPGPMNTNGAIAKSDLRINHGWTVNTD